MVSGEEGVGGAMPRVATQWAVFITPYGWSFKAAPDVSLLDAAKSANYLLPSSCRNGTCRTCMCRLESGSIEYRIEWPGLSIEEKRDGYILPCVAFARSDLVLHAPAAKAQKPVVGGGV